MPIILRMSRIVGKQCCNTKTTK